MSFKSDIQATRFTTTAATAIVAPATRLRGVIATNNDTTNIGTVILTTTSQAGPNLFQIDVPAGDVVNFSLPEDGIVFPKGIFVSTMTTVNSVTLLTDKYSAPGLTSE